MSQWTQPAEVSSIPEGDVIAVAVGGTEVALYQVNGEIFATDNVCSHGHARLCEGFLDGHEIECPLHQGKFDVRSGQPTCAPVTEPLKTYPLKIEGGQVWLDLS
jgi:naphthalene 1,2-dioxygenase system ferredoxin subunit